VNTVMILRDHVTFSEYVRYTGYAWYKDSIHSQLCMSATRVIVSLATKTLMNRVRWLAGSSCYVIYCNGTEVQMAVVRNGFLFAGLFCGNNVV
jgi:hypothetical protein